MGGLFGIGSKGPSKMAQREQQFRQQMESTNQANQIAAQAAASQAAAASASKASAAYSITDPELQKKSAGGYFGATSPGTFLGNSTGSRGTFLGY